VAESGSVPAVGGGIALSIMTLYALKSQAAVLYVELHREDIAERPEYARPSIDRLESLAAAAGSGCIEHALPRHDQGRGPEIAHVDARSLRADLELRARRGDPLRRMRIVSSAATRLR
jgi:hypothetical protein